MFDSYRCRKKDGTPLKSYETAQEADEAIRYVKKKYGNVQVKYKCPNCGMYHLSPVDRATPNKSSLCLDSKGNPKQAYNTRESAERRAQIILKEKGVKLSVYKCFMCGEYHLTHKGGF